MSGERQDETFIHGVIPSVRYDFYSSSMSGFLTTPVPTHRAETNEAQQEKKNTTLHFEL